METIQIDIENRSDNRSENRGDNHSAIPCESDATNTRQDCSLAMLHAPQAALDAARRLYRYNRTGLRFFCENRRVVPVDQLGALDEFGESGAAPLAVFIVPSSSPEATRSTM